MPTFLPLEQVIRALRFDEAQSEWLVSPEGELLDGSDLIGGGVPDTVRLRIATMLEGTQLYLADANGAFNFDRGPDFYVVPPGELGEAVLIAARDLQQAVGEADEAQQEYLEALDMQLTAERANGGPLTLGQLGAAVFANNLTFAKKRGAELELRTAFLLALADMRLEAGKALLDQVPA